MAQVKREDFVPEARKAIAYLDEDLPLKDGRYLIEPMAFARMIHLALIKPTDRVLVVGAGTGYGARVISMLAKSVVALESDPELAGLARGFLAGDARVEVVEGSLAEGYPAGAPYDVIIVEGRIAPCERPVTNWPMKGALWRRSVTRMFPRCRLRPGDGHRSSRSAFDVSIGRSGIATEKSSICFF